MLPFEKIERPFVISGPEMVRHCNGYIFFSAMKSLLTKTLP